jgi:hypothetical protein
VVVGLLDNLANNTTRDIPPFSGDEWLEYLLELGILRRRADGRVDAPDLFLAGLGLRRKGGVRKGMDK